MSKKFLALVVIVGVFSSGIFSHFFVSFADAATINNQINFQGKLVNTDGTNVADSTYSVVFSLYNVSSAGTAVWTETDSVTTSGGVFQVALGATTSLSTVDFSNSSLYLGIKVGTDAEMTPRIRFSAVPYAFNAAALDGVVATESATGFSLQGGSNTLSTLAVTTSGGVLTFQPGVAEGLTLQSNGANGLTLDTGGGAAISIGNTNATSVAFGKTANNTGFTFNNGSGGFAVNGTGSITFSALNSANGLVYTSGTNGVLSQTAPTSGSQCLQSNAGNTALAWIACSALGTNFFQMPNSGAIAPFSTTADFLIGGTATTSAKFAFMNSIGAGTPTASISAGAAGATFLAANGVLQTTNNQALTLGGTTTGNIIINPVAGNYVGIGTANPLASLDIRAVTALNGGTIPIASISGSTSFAGLVVNNSGAGDLVTASSSGITRFRMSNNGSTVFQGDTITSVGSSSNNAAVASETNDSAVTNAIGDEGSLVPNSGFESAVTANKTTNVAAGPVADGWIATATMSAAVTRIATDSAKGSSSVLMKLNANQSTSVSSVCIPLSLKISAIYNLNFYANTANASPVVRGFVDGFANKASCQTNTTPTPFVQGSVTTSSAGWKTYGGATAMTTSGTNTWGRVRISVNCPASCTTGTTIEIDGIRLIETSNAVGVDYAEEYPADPNDIPQAGDVVSLEASSGASLVAKSHIPMDQSLLGVVSTNPGQDLDDGSISGPKVPVALVGRVPVNVSTANGPIHIGDYLTSSSVPGVAVKATSAGSIIGTAMTEDTDSNTTDISQVTMFIKNSYYNGGTETATDGLNVLTEVQDPSILLTMLQGIQTASSSALTSLTTGQVTDGLTYLASVLGSATQSASMTEQGKVIPSVFGSMIASTISGLTVNGSATISADLHVKGNSLIEGVLHVADTLFANNLIANGISDFFGNVIFHSGVTFNDAPVFDSDTAGFAVVKKGSNHVVVTFSKSYDHTPIINASITLNPITPTPSETLSQQQERESQLEDAALENIHYIIINRTTRGFTILLQQPADQDISFSWVALAVNSPMIFQSNGQNLQLPTPSESVSPSPIDSLIPTSIPVSPTLAPTGDILPTPTPGG